MPGFNGSGPMGAGPMTGWGRGLCGRPAGTGNLPVYGGRGYGYGYGRGMGFRRGFGRGMGRGFGPAVGGYGYPPETGYGYPPEAGYGYPANRNDEIEMLRSNAEAMKNSLEAIQQKIAELEKEGSE